MILSELVIDFKLRGAVFTEFHFVRVQFIELADSMGALVITAFVDRGFGSFFPKEQGFVAIGAAIFGRFFEARF